MTTAPNDGCLPDSLELVPALDLNLAHSEALVAPDVLGNIPADITADERPVSAISKETSSEGEGEENLHLLDTPQAEAPGQQALLHPGSIQGVDDVIVRRPSYEEMQKEAEDCCPSWNWPLIRNLCLGVNAAVWLGVLAVCIGWIVAMPRKCDPFRKWYQGEAMYEIFPGSFQDSDGDGVGDLRGIQSRLYYVKNLEVNTIVLTSMLETPGFPQDVGKVSSFTRVDPKLGTAGDFLNLVSDAHAMDLHVVVALDPVPLLDNSPGADMTMVPTNLTQSQEKATYPELVHVLEHWLQHGVDGFILRNLETVVNSVDVEALAQDVRNLLDRYTVGMEDRILIVPIELLKALKDHDRHNATKVLHRIDLLDCQLHIQDQSPQEIADQISEIMSWDESSDTPWFNWRLASADMTRLSRRLGRNHTVGATVLQSLLPGTVTLLYGDEVCLMEAEPQENQTLPGLGIMPWSDDVTSADFSLSWRLPWRPLPADHALFNAASQQNITVQSVRLALGVHRSAVPVYVNGIFNSIGDFNPRRSSNLKVRYVDEAVIVLDRFYPRQPRWCAIFNTAERPVTRDLSHIFFRGLVMASSTGDKQGFIRFKELRLEAGEGLLVKLDR
ncbi:4F2 cell-surface antigen heavy chain-like [Pollicipes pollicipes]|uniref:4F2 cell-surface antigen heavy chain-like n=1 Tax=Pollicipes pollicipes TaxID=41117 RepID=UPI0018853598|nr:4F2 cell-surface antigen heavy chain-like [Pollicipes pollicipes]